MSENDAFYISEFFQAYFKTSAQSLVLKADAPLFTVLAVSDKYLKLTHKDRSEVINRGLFEVFPGNDSDPSERHSVYSSFKRVIESKLPDKLPTFRYEIYDPVLKRMEIQYWSNLNEPLFDSEGNVASLVTTTTNITEQILNHDELLEARKMLENYTNEQQLNEKLLVSNENLAIDNAQLGIEQRVLQDLIAQLTASEAKLEQAEMTLRLAVEAAKVGTWYVRCPNRELRVSNRLKELHGFYPADKMRLDEFVMQVRDDHRQRIMEAIEKAMVTVGPYDESYPIIGFHDKRVRWVRALGNTAMQQGDFLAFTGVIMDITDEKADEQRKNDFISMVSHELKSPLTLLGGYTQILKARAKNSQDAFTISTLDKMNAQMKKMTSMINGFLNTGHLESGKIHLQFIEFNLEGLVNEQIDDLRITATTHILNIGRCDPVQVFADRDKIGTVISNLLSNAVKYSPKGKYIQVNCAVIGGRVQVSVKDEGMGLAANDIKTLFERYSRVKTYDTEKIAGFGIGLYLCAEIVRRHKGEIWVESELGKGSAFYFDLPVLPNS